MIAVLPELVSPGAKYTGRQLHQFNCLGRVIRSLAEKWARGGIIDARTIKVLTISDVAKSPAELYREVEAAGLLINVSGVSVTDILLDLWHGQTVDIAPAFPCSYAQNIIRIDTQAKDPAPASLPATQLTLDSQPQLSPALHYARFSPLPASSGDAAYQRTSAQRTSQQPPSKHALAMLTYTAKNTLLRDIETDKKMLTSLIERFKWITSVTLIVDCSVHSDISNRSLSSTEKNLERYLSSNPGLSVTAQTKRTIGFTHLYSLMTKSDVGLFAASALYPDALRTRLPVYLWRQPDDRDIDINTLWNDPRLLDDMSMSLKQVATRQQTQFDRATTNELHSGTTISNNKAVLEKAILQLLTKLAALEKAPTLPICPDSEVEPVIDLPLDIHQDSSSRQFKRNLRTTQRKFNKLRQSPLRFVQDSNHTLIKKLKPFLIR